LKLKSCRANGPKNNMFGNPNNHHLSQYKVQNKVVEKIFQRKVSF